MSYIVGADPGRHGAVVVLDSETGRIVKMIPTKMQKNTDFIDHNWLWEQLFDYYDACDAVWMEHVHAIFGSSAGATFAFGDAFGALRVTLGTSLFSSQEVREGKQVQLVQPKVWQKVAWKGIDVIADPKLDEHGNQVLLKSGSPKMVVDTKATSLKAAQALFPGESFIMPRCRKPHDGVVDAALIAYYGLVMRRLNTDSGTDR